MDAWLACTVGPGQFSSEFSVIAKSSSGQLFSLFVPRKFVEVAQNPSRDQPVSGKVRVEVLEQVDNHLLVHLPGEPMDNGRTLSVTDKQVEIVKSKRSS